MLAETAILVALHSVAHAIAVIGHIPCRITRQCGERMVRQNTHDLDSRCYVATYHSMGRVAAMYHNRRKWNFIMCLLINPTPISFRHHNIGQNFQKKNCVKLPIDQYLAKCLFCSENLNFGDFFHLPRKIVGMEPSFCVHFQLHNCLCIAVWTVACCYFLAFCKIVVHCPNLLAGCRLNLELTTWVLFTLGNDYLDVIHSLI